MLTFYANYCIKFYDFWEANKPHKKLNRFYVKIRKYLHLQLSMKAYDFLENWNIDVLFLRSRASIHLVSRHVFGFSVLGRVVFITSHRHIHYFKSKSLLNYLIG